MNSSYRLVYILVAFNIIPHVFDLPVWIVATAMTFLGWRVAAEFTKTPLPGRMGTLALALVSILAIVNEFGTFIGDEASTATLLLMASLKTFEMKTYRDVMVMTYLCYFLLMTKLIASQSIAMTVFMVVDILLITGFMMMYHAPLDQSRWGKLLRRASILTLQSLPLVLILFFTFPRFTANLWGRGEKPLAKVGFSGELRPGEISQLMLSDEPAFRVFFPDIERPSFNQLYWRGVVLDQSKGLKWEASGNQNLFTPLQNIPLNETVKHEVILEPHGRKWLFALDWPMQVEFPDDFRRLRWAQTNTKSLRARREVAGREFYTVYSQIHSSLVNWSRGNLKSYLKVEDTNSPQTKAFAEALKKDSTSSSEVVQKILQHFSKEGYTYTLSPPTSGSLDEFLFKKRRGFCEHYAAALASLLRWAEIPARVVIGYQGGTQSFLADYLLIRQLDAHAWVEYWEPSRATWVRVDPTTVVAPDRLSLGAQRFNDQLMSESTQLAANFQLSHFMGAEWAQRFFRLSMIFDQAEASWMGFLLRYDFSYQQELFASLGWGRVSKVQLGLICLSVLALLVIFVSWRMATKTRRLTSSQRLYRRLCHILEKQGLPRRSNEGPLAYKARALECFPERSKELTDAFEDIIALRYGVPLAKNLSFKDVVQKISKLR